MSDWYTITEGNQIEFQKSKDRYWAPETIRINPLSIQSYPATDWIITGWGPMWMYAHAAATLAAANCKSQVRLGGTTGTSENLANSRCRFHPTCDPRCAVFEMDFAQEAHLTDAAIERLMDPALSELCRYKVDKLCITGRANGKAYAAVAAKAVENQVRIIQCLTPADGQVIVYDADGSSLGERPEPESWLTPYLTAPKSTLIVGIIGDPNCGKSVFSLALNHYRGAIKCQGWRLDCDGASPTPDWYLSLSEKDPAQAKSAREAVKLSWTSDMEDLIAEKIIRLRQFFAVAIADLPGGNHTKTPPERVPNHREVMMREVDVFILIERANESSELAWRTALAPHRLDHRIRVVLSSVDPNGTPSLEVCEDHKGIWRGIIRGLDRAKKPDELVPVFQNGLNQIWPALLRHSRSDGAGQ
ncbi:MAG: hypothetical protein R3B84_14060 [Zavarzinella sp.]